jgi:nucleotide-binding universal stress UspA family protein
MAHVLAAELLVLHVLDVPPDGRLFEPSLRRVAERDLERLRAAASSTGVTARTAVAVGDVPREIVRVAREAGATMIVMGTRGRTGLRRALLRSVGEWVVRHAPCPVLTVRYIEVKLSGSSDVQKEPGHGPAPGRPGLLQLDRQDASRSAALTKEG